ncbi:TPA: cysteine hydrolase [Thermoplasmata archaeon]|nr:cysteine hydrolase [Thermoplasmata archaeon]
MYEPDSNQNLKMSVERRLGSINEAIDWFRQKGLPIIVGYTEGGEEAIQPDTWRFQVPESIHVQDVDHRVTKRHANAFANPELGAALRRLGCDTFLILGLSASGCVLATYFSAYDFDVRPFLVKGCVASANEEHVRFAEDICDTLTLEELDKLMQQEPPP